MLLAKWCHYVKCHKSGDFWIFPLLLIKLEKGVGERGGRKMMSHYVGKFIFILVTSFKSNPSFFTLSAFTFKTSLSFSTLKRWWLTRSSTHNLITVKSYYILSTAHIGKSNLICHLFYSWENLFGKKKMGFLSYHWMCSV